MTVVTPVWNRKELLETFFAAIGAQTQHIDEVIVVDNGSTDGAPEECERRGARVLRMGENAGFARAVNRGIRAARTELVAVLNNDIELEPDYLERLARAVASGGVWFASGKILSAHNRRRIDGAWDEMARSCCAWRAGHGREDGPVFSRARRVWSVPATAAVYRRALFERLGYFDDRFESYLEDIEFGLRCALAGYGGRYQPDAVAYHVGSATLGTWHRETVRRIARNQVFLAARYTGFTWAVFAGQALWGLGALRRGCLGPWLRGKREGWQARERFVRSAAEVLASSEQEILALQRTVGWDAYWRVYFFLSRGVMR
jgi:hypothetical protein